MKEREDAVTIKHQKESFCLSAAQWEELAALAKLELKEEDRGAPARDLGLLRELAASLADCPVCGETAKEEQALRADEVGACLPQTEILSAAPQADGDYIAVPAVLSLGEKEGA